MAVQPPLKIEFSAEFLKMLMCDAWDEGYEAGRQDQGPQTIENPYQREN